MASLFVNFVWPNLFDFQTTLARDNIVGMNIEFERTQEEDGNGFQVVVIAARAETRHWSLKEAIHALACAIRTWCWRMASEFRASWIAYRPSFPWHILSGFARTPFPFSISKIQGRCLFRKNLSILTRCFRNVPCERISFIR